MIAASVTTGEAWRAAADWVRAEAAPIPEFVGALVAGSTREREPGAPHPDGSDVDVWVVVDAAVPDFMHDPRHRFAVRKFRHGEVILERGFKPWEALADPGRVLGDPHLAPNLAAPVILADPSGRLARLAAAVGPAFPRRSHALRRVDAKLANAERFCGFAASGAAPPGFDPFVVGTALRLVAADEAAGAVAVAALQQPSPRRAFVHAGALLAQHGLGDLAEELLAALGSARLGAAEVAAALEELSCAWDAAVEVRRTVFGMDYELSRDARSFALGGVRELVDAGHPREAMFRLAFLRSLAQNALEHDASPGDRARFRRGYMALLSSMGLDTDARRAERVEVLRALLPRLRAACEDVLAGTPGVVDDR
ncbi:MAG TPA: hypothetical protein VEB43_12925 [Anaeromyxobacter sp.]|nr:hypothetical protein [Anaeromyxobacter sp.]